MQFTGQWKAVPGQATWIDFDLDDRRVQARGIVVWSTPTNGGYRWGIRFTALHSSSATVIANYVERGMVAAYQGSYPQPDEATRAEEEPATQLWAADDPPVGGTQIVSVQGLSPHAGTPSIDSTQIVNVQVPSPPIDSTQLVSAHPVSPGHPAPAPFPPGPFGSGPTPFAPSPSAFAPAPSGFAPEPPSFPPQPSAYTPEPSSFSSGPSAYPSGPSSYPSGPSAYPPAPSAFEPASDPSQTQVVATVQHDPSNQTSLQLEPPVNPGVAVPAFVPPPAHDQAAPQDLPDLPLATSLGLDFGPESEPLAAEPLPARRPPPPLVIDLPRSYVGPAPTAESPQVSDAPTGVGYLPPTDARVATGVSSVPLADLPTGMTSAPDAALLEPSTDVQSLSIDIGIEDSGYEAPTRGSARTPDSGFLDLPDVPAPAAFDLAPDFDSGPTAFNSAPSTFAAPAAHAAPPPTPTPAAHAPAPAPHTPAPAPAPAPARAVEAPAEAAPATNRVSSGMPRGELEALLAGVKRRSASEIEKSKRESAAAPNVDPNRPTPNGLKARRELKDLYRAAVEDMS